MQNLLSSSLLSKNIKIKRYRIIILSVIFYGCETWSVTLRQRLLEKRVLRKTYAPEKDEVKREWRRPWNVQLYYLYPLPNIIQVVKLIIRWLRVVARVGKECCTEGLVGKPERKNALEVLGVDGRIILKWILKKSDGGMDWFDLVQNRDKWRAVVNEVMNLRVP